MTEKKFYMCEICTKTFEGESADSHVEIFLNTINIRNSGYKDQHYSDIARLGMCYDCLKKGLTVWQLPKILERVEELKSGKLIKAEQEQGFNE